MRLAKEATAPCILGFPTFMVCHSQIVVRFFAFRSQSPVPTPKAIRIFPALLLILNEAGQNARNRYRSMLLPRLSEIIAALTR